MKAIFLTLFFLLTVSFSLFAQTKEEVVTLLHEIDDQRTRFNNRIIYISDEFNFGIPGGTNWLIKWEGRHTVIGRVVFTMVYVVDVDAREMLFRQSFPGGPDAFPQYFESLPGRTFANSQIGDFNGEGFDMILSFEVSGMGSFFSIDGFDPQTGRIEAVIDPFDFSFDERDERPPVRFVTYRGMQGFIFRFFDPPQVAGGPTWTPDPPDPRAGRWFFYTWDAQQRMFVEVGEVDEAFIEGDWHPGENPAVEPIQEQNDITANQLGADTIEETVPITTAEQPLSISQSGAATSPLLTWMWIVIASGVIGGVVLVVKRKKR